MGKKSLLIAILFTIFSLSINSANAQLLSAIAGGSGEDNKPQEYQEDVLHRQTPKGLVDGFIHAVRTENYGRASLFLDLENFPPKFRKEKGAELSRGLQKILDQSGSVMSASKLSNNPNGNQDDELALNLDIVGVMKINGDNVHIIAEKFPHEEYGHVWKISSETVSNIPNALKKLSIGYLDRFLPEILITTKSYGVPVGHWAAICAIAVISLIISWILSFMLLFFIRLFWKKSNEGFAKHLLEAFLWPIRLYLAVAIFVVITRFVGLSIIARQHLSIITSIITWFSVAWVFWSIIEIVTETSKIRLLREKKRSALSAVVFFRRTARTLLVLIFLAVALRNMGIDITAGLTALGIGGLVLAFSAQKSLENFMASLNIIVEQPIRIGDLCKIGDVIGHVQDIGMRSTRIKTLYRSLVTIPNSHLASQTIENYAHRDRFLFRHEIGLRYETTPDQLRYIMIKMRELLYSHPCVDPDYIRVRLSSFASSSLNVDVFAYVYAEEYNEYMEVQEDLLLRFMDIITEGGSSFAFPSSTVYVGKDELLPKDKQKAAEAETQKIREEKSLKLHRLDVSEIDDLANTIDYPPLSNNSDVKYF